MTSEQTFVVSHPYYPQNADIPGYAPNAAPLVVLVGSFVSIVGIVLGTSLTLARRVNDRLGTQDQFLVAWFVLCGFLHLFFEGYYVLHYKAIAGSQGLFSQLWKEYALSDSRYLTSDPFILCIETFTAVVWGPLCWVIAACIAKGHFLRHSLQIAMSVGHLYGVILYYGTCYFEHKLLGVTFSRPEFQYRWLYYVGFNLPWVMVPFYVLVNSSTVIYRYFNGLESVAKIVKDYQAAECGTPEAKKTI